MKTGILALGLCATLAAPPMGAQEAVFLIRHGEKQATGEDPGLTGAGQARAAAWAGMLASAGIDAVITTEARRTRETGDIVAQALDVERTEVAVSDVTGVLDLLGFDYAEDRVLVVGHAETIPSILSGLGVREAPEIGQEVFDTMFVVVPASDGAPVLTHLHMPMQPTRP
ncbi:histidine phosphatase family protein [Tropicimonas isoalkanivorans]|uniref:Phosphohistidine phosphatase SixA n=1 Tax=Tropicimonas isoalkanivorans TaxID=441112 RepID=A0A1I1E1H3_9RHOB|nr:histidine phosphatase family protein [Tropicimonas isoalkanivorans]SFB80526.1 Phosphohistidine phosphatase SixA [Tropicimonas isoalkanivorans]